MYSKVVDARRGQFRELVGSIERSLCDYTPPSGKWNVDSPNEAVAGPAEARLVRELVTLLRSRYARAGPDAKCAAPPSQLDTE